MPTIDIAGRRFGALTAVSPAGSGKWLFRCDCGREKEIEREAVMQGLVSSCGCGCLPWRSGYARFISMAEANGVSLDCFINRLRAGLSPEDACERDLSWLEASSPASPESVKPFFSREIWRPAPGYEGLYEVSSRGRVKSLKRKMLGRGGSLYRVQERILSPSRSQSGFRHVQLRRDGKTTTFGVHVLVAQAFVEGQTAENCTVHHKDGNPANNAASNLEWCRQFYGVGQDAVQKRRVATRRRQGPWDSAPKPVELVHDGEVVARYGSAKEAARQENLCATAIRNQCKGSRSRRSGYQWRYAVPKEED